VLSNVTTYATLFAATEEEIAGIFPGWSLPRAAPVEVRKRNPFTGEEKVFWSWTPGSPDDKGRLSGSRGFSPVGSACEPILPPDSVPIPPALPPEGPEEEELEELAPPALRTLPHVALEVFFPRQLEALASALGVRSRGRPARVAPDGRTLECLPEMATWELAAVLEEDLPRLAKEWAEADAREWGFSTGFVEDAPVALRRVHALARIAAATGRRICLFLQTFEEEFD
jgi:hypothetical protein